MSSADVYITPANTSSRHAIKMAVASRARSILGILFTPGKAMIEKNKTGSLTLGIVSSSNWTFFVLGSQKLSHRCQHSRGAQQL